ncbi:hypothetical protein HHL22_02560 [Hymenobacter sp. RP-2-7]|uniref:DUF3784 domain-containing protein n=1 Tax=Hymenobacter polaris TaxID=2682546 RepID=A0A7Y0FKU2_9BACT|nr:hypothetical protein [Hymenobacter polaris]NML64077.1 hypothetical protein [Hymenobacter polaris]
MSIQQVALAAGIFFWSLLGMVPIYFGIRIWQNKLRGLPIKGYYPEKAQNLTGLNKWVGSCLLLMGLVLIGGGVLAGTVSLLFIVLTVALTSLCATALERGAARYY